MVDFRLISSRVEIEFEPDMDGAHESEFNQGRSNIDEWLSIEMARGEGENSDPLTIKLLVELYKKVEELSNIIKNQHTPPKPLKFCLVTSKIGYEGFEFDTDCLEIGTSYFARVNLPLFIKREVMVYFKAITPKCAKILKISRGNEREWNAFVAESERLEIRKVKNSEQ
ncbi:hypothetical protein [Campylobacter sp. P091]|uniref:hypothetical protein n=1 Tax=Campylobacter sp. P091 TaxID=1895621 RepID=UPI000A34AA26|nr:hypothetical protein [Campylobacter sp. P091]